MSDPGLIFENLKTRLPQAVVRRNEPLGNRTTLRVGGCADVYVEPSSEEDLGRVIRRSHRMGTATLEMQTQLRGRNLHMTVTSARLAKRSVAIRALVTADKGFHYVSRCCRNNEVQCSVN